MELPESLDAAWLASGAATELRGYLSNARQQRFAALSPSLGVLAWPATYTPLAGVVERWGKGKGAVGRWFDAHIAAERLYADGGDRKAIARANEKAAELLPAAQTEWAETRAGLNEYFADVSQETGESAQPSDPLRVAVNMKGAR